jgi:hypothetical protein
MQDLYYVYLLKNPETQEPFYVGKGKNKRAYSHLNGIDKSNKLKQKYIENLKEKGLTPIIEFYKSNISEKEAFDIEKKLIEKYGRIHNNKGNLTNILSGGQGLGDENNPNSNHKWSIDQKEIARKRQLVLPTFKGKHHTEEHKAYMSSIQKKHSFWQVFPDFSIKKWESTKEFMRFYKLNKYSRGRIYTSLKNPSCKFQDTYLRDNTYENIKENKLIDISIFLKEIDNKHNKETIQKTLDGKTIKVWKSRSELIKELSSLNIDASALTKYIKKGKPYKGFLWENTH